MKGFFCKITLALCFVIFVGSAARADEVTFSANAPMVVTAGESFRVEFSLNATPDDDSFEAPDFGAFDVLAGPAISQGHSIQIINGAMTKNVNYTITYVLLAQDAGNITIGPASIKVDKKKYKTQPLPIEISDKPSAGSAQASQGNSGSSDKSIEEEAQGQISKDDLLLRVHVSKQSVFKGEPLLATFKLYRRVAIVGYEDIKFPSFNGFWTQDIDVSNAMWQRETLNGKVYESTVVKECLLYPQQAGTLVIEPATITAIAQVIVQSRRNIDPFFGGGHEVYNLRRKLQTPRVNITVKELPAGAPASFTGAVGKFSMDASLSADQLAANSAGTFTVKITGQGNLPFIQAPKLTLPASFEQYNVKTTESIQTATAGTSGYRQFEYPFIARAEGTYRIDSILFTYFNPDRREYVTLSSQSFPLQITPDANGGESYMVKGLSKEDVQMLGQDIRFIRLGKARLQPMREPFFLSGLYIGLLAAILVLFAGTYIALRKQIRDSQNAALIRGRRANKVAIQRFRIAKNYMEEHNQHAFYEEMLKALWGYMSDKFNIPVANLTKENVREELHKRGAAPEDTQLFSELITRCDEAQYSPVASARMSDVYRDGLELISRIESIIKR